MIKLVDLDKQDVPIQTEIINAIRAVIQKKDFILGHEVKEFENQFAKYCGVKYCIGVASGTDALLLSLKAINVNPNNEVITPCNTFISTVFAILQSGAKPILVDVEEKSALIDIGKIEKAITPKTAAIIPVHMYGNPVDMKKINILAKKHGVKVIEDACQAHGSLYENNYMGSWGDLGCFSFYPSKNLGAYGDGGAIVTNNKSLAQQIQILRNVGQTTKNKHLLLGYSSRLDTIQAAVLSVKLKYLNTWNKRRVKIAKLYKKLLSDIPIGLLDVNDNCLPNYYLYVIRTPERDKLLKHLKQNGVSCSVHYPTPIHMQPSMKTLGYKKGDFPVAEKLSKEVLSLPMHPYLQTKEVIQIVNLIKKFHKNDK